MVANDPLDTPEVQKPRAKIFEDYTGTVFAERTSGSPPVRGPFGEATIQLKPNVVPVKQRAFQIQGERRDAWASLIDRRVEDGKLEDGVGPWNSPSFPVAEKGTREMAVSRGL